MDSVISVSEKIFSVMGALINYVCSHDILLIGTAFSLLGGAVALFRRIRG